MTLAAISLGSSLIAGLPALADDIVPMGAIPIGGDGGEGPVYSIGRFELEYSEPHPDHPPLDTVLPAIVELAPTPSGYAAPVPGEPTEEVEISDVPGPARDFHASAIGTISRTLLASVHDLGLLGVYVLPSTEDIDAETERDLRPPGETSLRFSVWTGRVKTVRTIAVGDRIKGDWVVNNKKQKHVRRMSPIQPEGEGREGSTDLLRKDELEDYLFFLNRHPGRYAEASLSASEDGEGIALDYRLHESRPWTVYAQSSNTGSERTNPWQTRLGFIHRQVTNNDDIFSFEYLNAGGDNVNAIQGSYIAPWFRKERPGWLKKSGFEPKWLAWLNRDKIPWWGSDRLRWRIGATWSRVKIRFVDDLPDPQNGNDKLLNLDWSANGQLIYNFWQHRNFFLDGFAGVNRRNLQVHNEVLGNRGTAQLWEFPVGFKFERVNEYSNLFGFFSYEYGFSNSNQSNFESDLGRPNSDHEWNVLRWDLTWSHFLEPLINSKEWKDPSTPRSSTLAHEFFFLTRGQYGFDYRLIPQVSQVIGGLYSVRGFDPGIAVGDSIYLGTFEYRFHLPRALPIRRQPVNLPVIGDFRVQPQQVYGRPDWDFIIRGFVDAGYSVRNRRGDNPSASETNQTLVSAGVGLEANFRGHVSLRADWGRGLYRKVDSFCQGPGCPNIPDGIDKSGKFHLIFSISY